MSLSAIGWGRFENPDPVTAQASRQVAQNYWLTDLMDDPVNFGPLLQATSDASLQNLLGGRAGAKLGTAMLSAALDRDAPEQLDAVVAAISRLHAQHPRTARKRWVAPLPQTEELVQRALASKRFRVASAFLQTGALSPQRFSQHLGKGAQEELRRMVTCGALPAATYLTLYPEATDDALLWVENGMLSYRVFFDSRVVTVSDAALHVACGIVDPEVCMNLFAGRLGEAALATALVDAGHTTPATALAYVDDDATREDLAEHWFRLGQLPVEIFRAYQDLVYDHVPCASSIVRARMALASIQTTLAPTITQMRLMRSSNSGLIDICVSFALHYDARRGLTREEIAHIEQFTMEAMLSRRDDALDATAYRRAWWPQDATQRTSYGLRLLAARIQGAAAYRVLPTHTVARSCLSCSETFDSDNCPAKPGACEHAADMCQACVRTAAQSHPTDICPYPSCTTPLTPNDLLRWGASSNAAGALARRIVARWQTQQKQWHPCGTQDCLGGARSWPPGGVHSCALCDQTTSLSGRIQVDPRADRPKILRLLRDVGATLSIRSRVRECYNCGVASEHVDGCTHMACPRCERSWDFVRGRMTSDFKLGFAQRYVPRDSLLVRLGIYKGLTPGTCYNSLEIAAVVRANAIRLGYWYA